MPNSRCHLVGNPQPYWDIKVREALGREGEIVGGVSGIVQTSEAALDTFRVIFPELSAVPLVAVRTSGVPVRASDETP